jgi:hypothetical protein
MDMHAFYRRHEVRHWEELIHDLEGYYVDQVANRGGIDGFSAE